jgi:hypothetical protein
MGSPEMVRRIFVDIETLPPDKGSSAASVQEEIGSCSDEEFRRLALDGDYGRVLTVGVIVEHDGQVIHRGLLGRERQTMLFHLDEARTLRGFWRLLRGFNVSRDLVVGHNLFDFDLPFLYKRSIIQRVRPTVELPFTRSARGLSSTPCTSGTSGRHESMCRLIGWPRFWGWRVLREGGLTEVASTINSAPGVTRRSPTTAFATWT